MAAVRLAFTFNVDLTVAEFDLIQTALKRKLEGADVAAARELAGKFAKMYQTAVRDALAAGEQMVKDTPAAPTKPAEPEGGEGE